MKKSLELAPEIIEAWEDYSNVLSRLQKFEKAKVATDKIYELEDLERLK